MPPVSRFEYIERKRRKGLRMNLLHILKTIIVTAVAAPLVLIGSVVHADTTSVSPEPEGQIDVQNDPWEI